MPFQKGNKLQVSRKGIPNAATSKAREIIARIANDTAPKIDQWLMEVEDPAKRLDLYLKLIEYHIPKLARTEVTGGDGEPLVVQLVQYARPAS